MAGSPYPITVTLGANPNYVVSTNDGALTVEPRAVKIQINQTYPLREAARAHRDLQDRKTTGSTVFTV